MKASNRTVRCRKHPPAWHAAFEAMIPAIETHAKIAFRHLNADAREEAVQEVVCNACCAYARLVTLKRTHLAYASVLARFGVAQAKAGRRVGGRLNVRDVTSEYCRQKKGVVVEQLDKFDADENCWLEVVVEDKHAGPAEVAATRIDFSTWLQILSRRERKIATLLAAGESTQATARKFHLTEGRISQIRRELHDAWHRFQGDLPAQVTA
jgi:hypothetical protein